MTEKKSDEAKRCRKCNTRRGVINKYDLKICRRCFKELAEKIGFRKLD